MKKQQCSEKCGREFFSLAEGLCQEKSQKEGENNEDP